MGRIDPAYQATMPLGGGEKRWWRGLQVLVFLVGLGLFGSLVFFPGWGIVAFWDVLIPVAPLLFLLSAGLWRNICPLATVALVPHHFQFSRKRRLAVKWQERLAMAGVVLLFLIVPARHLALNNDGLATALTLGFLGSLAFLGGFLFDSKSGWCASLCPVHPVEKLYGRKVGFTPSNAHCSACHHCANPCPDSTPQRLANGHSPQRKGIADLSATLLTGGLPGFIWGWFHVADCRGGADWRECAAAFGLPWGSLLVSLAAYIAVRRFLPKEREVLLTNLFAAASISCYYWYRIPALLGFGIFPQDGLLVDLSMNLPRWSIWTAQVSAVVFFAWWLVVRDPPPAVWAIRPPFLVKRK